MKFTPVNTCIASDFRIDIPQINEAKKLLAEKYDSKFNIPSHITVLLMPFTQELFDEAKPEIEEYFQKLKPVNITIGDLICELDRRFLSLKVNEEEILPIHRKLLALAGKYRTNQLREKDIRRLEEGRYSDIEKTNLEKHGFAFSDNLFNSHLTLGNVSTTDVDLSEVKKQLDNLLKPILRKQISLSRIKLVFHTDSPIQSDIVELWSKEYDLSLQG